LHESSCDEWDAGGASKAASVNREKERMRLSTSDVSAA
jgi:hypothetical protein